MTPDVAAIAAGLKGARRKVVAGVQNSMEMHTFGSLVRDGLMTEDAKLTPLGLRVKAILEDTSHG